MVRPAPPPRRSTAQTSCRGTSVSSECARRSRRTNSSSVTRTVRFGWTRPDPRRLAPRTLRLPLVARTCLARSEHLERGEDLRHRPKVSRGTGSLERAVYGRPKRTFSNASRAPNISNPPSKRQRVPAPASREKRLEPREVHGHPRHRDEQVRGIVRRGDKRVLANHRRYLAARQNSHLTVDAERRSESLFDPAATAARLSLGAETTSARAVFLHHETQDPRRVSAGLPLRSASWIQCCSRREVARPTAYVLSLLFQRASSTPGLTSI